MTFTIVSFCDTHSVACTSTSRLSSPGMFPAPQKEVLYHQHCSQDIWGEPFPPCNTRAMDLGEGSVVGLLDIGHDPDTGGKDRGAGAWCGGESMLDKVEWREKGEVGVEAESSQEGLLEPDSFPKSACGWQLSNFLHLGAAQGSTNWWVCSVWVYGLIGSVGA
jgi:hypothetical protein